MFRRPPAPSRPGTGYPMNHLRTFRISPVGQARVIRRLRLRLLALGVPLTLFVAWAARNSGSPAGEIVLLAGIVAASYGVMAWILGVVLRRQARSTAYLLDGHGVRVLRNDRPDLGLPFAAIRRAEENRHGIVLHGPWPGRLLLPATIEGFGELRQALRERVSVATPGALRHAQVGIFVLLLVTFYVLMDRLAPSLVATRGLGKLVLVFVIGYRFLGRRRLQRYRGWPDGNRALEVRADLGG